MFEYRKAAFIRSTCYSKSDWESKKKKKKKKKKNMKIQN